MRHYLLSVAVASLTLSSVALACDGDEAHAEKFKTLSVQEVAGLQKQHKATLLDVNSEQTRVKYGVIPGAVLLTSFNAYDTAKALPAAKDQKLVFYCAAAQCMASHQAAERAVSAGYKDVAVMPAGIQGWKKAGMPTQALPRS